MHRIERFADGMLTYAKDIADEEALGYWDGFKKRHNGRFKGVETVYCLVKLGETLEEDEIIDKFEPKEVVVDTIPKG